MRERAEERHKRVALLLLRTSLGLLPTGSDKDEVQPIT